MDKKVEEHIGVYYGSYLNYSIAIIGSVAFMNDNHPDFYRPEFYYYMFVAAEKTYDIKQGDLCLVWTNENFCQEGKALAIKPFPLQEIPVFKHQDADFINVQYEGYAIVEYTGQWGLAHSVRGTILLCEVESNILGWYVLNNKIRKNIDAFYEYSCQLRYFYDKYIEIKKKVESFDLKTLLEDLSIEVEKLCSCFHGEKSINVYKIVSLGKHSKDLDAYLRYYFNEGTTLVDGDDYSNYFSNIPYYNAIGVYDKEHSSNIPYYTIGVYDEELLQREKTRLITEYNRDRHVVFCINEYISNNNQIVRNYMDNINLHKELFTNNMMISLLEKIITSIKISIMAERMTDTHTYSNPLDCIVEMNKFIKKICRTVRELSC